MIAYADRPSAAELDQLFEILMTTPLNRAQLLGSLQRVEQGIRAHGDELDRMGGLLDDADRANRMSLDREDARLRQEAADLLEEVREVRQEASAGLDDGRLIQRASELLAGLRGLRDAESSLVLESADTEVGAGD